MRVAVYVSSIVYLLVVGSMWCVLLVACEPRLGTGTLVAFVLIVALWLVMLLGALFDQADAFGRLNDRMLRNDDISFMHELREFFASSAHYSVEEDETLDDETLEDVPA